MRNPFLYLIVALACVLVSSSALLAQTKPAAPAVASHDLTGIWEFFQTLPGQGIYATTSEHPPPMTPWAQERFAAARPGYGPKAVIADGNDPILHCDPTGVPRVLFFPQPFEIVQTGERLFVFFERDHMWRPIWLNRRTHPADLEPLWVGDSVGWWEGDTFVIDTVGFNGQELAGFLWLPAQRTDASGGALSSDGRHHFEAQLYGGRSSRLT